VVTGLSVGVGGLGTAVDVGATVGPGASVTPGIFTAHPATTTTNATAHAMVNPACSTFVILTAGE